jgi:cysteine-rich repeat protein
MAVSVLVARSALATTADDICPPAADPCNVTQNTTVDGLPTTILDFGTRALVIKHGNTLSVAAGFGFITIKAGSLVIEPGAGLVTQGTNGNPGGVITVTTTGDINIQAAGTARGRIDVSGEGSGGTAILNAGGNFNLDGVIDGQSDTSDNDGGEIDVTTGGTITVHGSIDVTGGSQGSGGTISFEAGGAVNVVTLLDASGGDTDGGEIDIDSQHADISVGPLSVDGSATGSGGLVDITAQGNITLNGLITGAGAGSGGNGGDGGEVDAIANGTVRVLAQIQLPSGDGGFGGTLDLEAGSSGDLVISAPLHANGIGTDSCGGDNTFIAGQNMSFGDLDASGGQGCGGSLIANAVNGTATLSGTVDFENGGGSLVLQAQQIVLNAGTDINADGGQGSVVQLTGCQITVASGAKIESIGSPASNLLQASGAMMIAGTVTATSGGTNRFEWLTSQPTISGTVNPPATIAQNLTLTPCRVAACGNGTVDPGEECDDGNNVSCDGCSLDCKIERCGNGRVDCNEQCDDGALNGTSGDQCGTSCHLLTVGGLLFLPGTPEAVEGCYLEYGIRNPNGKVTGGFPSRTQSCIDGDPTCDSDNNNDGKCTFQVETCMHKNDSRLPQCQLFGIASVNLHRPDPLAPSDAVDGNNAASLITALESQPVQVLSGTTVIHAENPNFAVDACSPLVPLVVPHRSGHKGRRSFTLSADDVIARRMRNNHVKLECDPNPAVCGNGTKEIGEQCDDGNTTSCDGCSSTCRIEACGNGVRECNEDCDDGPLNGTPGDTCTAQCTVAPPALRISGGGKKAGECDLEWSMAIGAAVNGKDGFPTFKQSCTDGDPACDFSALPNLCRFHVWVCLGGADPRYTCPAETVTSVTLLTPNAKAKPPLNALRTSLLDAFAAVGLPVGPGERCTRRIDVDVPAGKRYLTLKTKTIGASGAVDRDTLRLRCNPATP